MTQPMPQYQPSQLLNWQHNMFTKFDAIVALVENPSFILEEDNSITWLSVDKTQPSEAEIQAKIAELTAAEPLRQLREQRTRILKESDWMANSDVTMSDAWRTYRQALRDLPANSPNVALDEQGNLINVTWPTKPE